MLLLRKPQSPSPHKGQDGSGEQAAVSYLSATSESDSFLVGLETRPFDPIKAALCLLNWLRCDTTATHPVCWPGDRPLCLNTTQEIKDYYGEWEITHVCVKVCVSVCVSIVDACKI